MYEGGFAQPQPQPPAFGAQLSSAQLNDRRPYTPRSSVPKTRLTCARSEQCVRSACVFVCWLHDRCSKRAKPRCPAVKRTRVTTCDISYPVRLQMRFVSTMNGAPDSADSERGRSMESGKGDRLQTPRLLYI